MIAFITGLLVGIIFFGGLYWTVQKINEVSNPSILIALSFVLRMAVLLFGLYYVSKSGYKDVLFALAGIMLMRYILIFTIRKPREKSSK